MHKLADNFIFRKVRRLRRTESDVNAGVIASSPSSPLLNRRKKLSLDIQLSDLPHMQNCTSGLPPIPTPTKNHQPPTPTPTVAPTICRIMDNRTKELCAAETPTQSISERIANEEVEDVMKNCSSVLGALPPRRSGGDAVERRSIMGGGGTINVEISGPVNILRANIHQQPHVVADQHPGVGSKLEQYVESLCDFSSIFTELSASMVSARSSQGEVADWSSKPQQLEGGGLKTARRFSYRVDSPRVLVVDEKSTSQHERPSSTPRLVQTNRHCQMARVTAITQEWMVDRECESAVVTGVCQPYPPWASAGSESSGDREPWPRVRNDYTAAPSQTSPQNYSSTFPRATGVGWGRVGVEMGAYSTTTRHHKLMCQSAEARLIEKAILDISERISQHRQGAPFTRAQDASREEMLRAKLAEMILHLGPEQDIDYDYGRALKEPILILKDKLHSLQRRVNSAALEVDSAEEELKLLPHSRPTEAYGRLVELRMRGREAKQRDGISARMTPLISLMHQKLESLEGVVDVGEDHARPSGRSTPYEERRTVHHLLIGINEEINKIYELCRRNSQMEGLNTVVQVLSRVCLQMDKIIETLRTNSASATLSQGNAMKTATPSSRQTPPFPLLDSLPAKHAKQPVANSAGSPNRMLPDADVDADVAVNCNVDISKEEEQELVQSFILDHRGPSPYHWRESAAVTLRDTCTSPFLKSSPSPPLDALPSRLAPTTALSTTPQSSELSQPQEARVSLAVDFNREGTHCAMNYTMFSACTINGRVAKDVAACDRPEPASEVPHLLAQPPSLPQYYLQLPEDASTQHGSGAVVVSNGDSAFEGASMGSTSISPSEGEEEDVPVLFTVKRLRAAYDQQPRQKETDILTDDDEEEMEEDVSASKSDEVRCDAEVQLYNMTASCSEIFRLRKRRKHALLNAVIYPEVGAKIRATFAGNSFLVDVERECETGRDSVVMVTEEYYGKWARVQKTHDSLLIERSISEDDTSVDIGARDGGGVGYVDGEALSKLAVSIMAKSVEDRVFVYLEEIPWGEVEMNIAAEEEPPFNKSHEEDTMVRSTTSYKDTSSVILNITVNENHEEAKSVASHRSAGGGSQKSLATSDGAPSQASADIPTYVIKPHSTASITCELNAFVDREAEIEWYKGRERIPRGEGKYERVSEDLLEVLIILDVTADDGQLYQIKVNREVYPVAYLIVEEGDGAGEAQEQEPRFLTPRQTLFMMQGQTAMLSCQMNKPQLEVVWYKEQQRLSGDGAEGASRVFFDRTSEGWYRLIIDEVDFGDQGTYHIHYGDLSTSITLIVEEFIEEREVQVSSAETDDEELNDYLVPTGSTATIACELDNTSSVHALHWQRNNLDLDVQETGKFEHVESGNKHYLIIHNAQPTDSGVYSVRVNEVKFKVAQITISDQQQSLGGSRVRHISASSINRGRLQS